MVKVYTQSTLSVVQFNSVLIYIIQLCILVCCTFCVPCAHVYTSALEHSPHMYISAYGDRDIRMLALDSVVHSSASVYSF